MSDSEVGGAAEMRISVSAVDDIDTTLEASRGCSNVSPDASGTREWFMQRQVGDGTGTDVGDVRAGSHKGLWTGTGIAVSLTGEGNPVPFSSTTSSSDDHHRRSISHLTSGGTVDSTAECLNLSLEELRSHRLLLGKRVRTVCGSLPHTNGGQEVWKKVRTVSLLHSGPSDLVSGCHADTADDDENNEGGNGGDGGDDIDDDMERDEDENEDIDRDGEVIGDETDEPSSHSVPTVIADGQTERWRERQEKAMMLAGKLAALASTSTLTSSSTSIAQRGSASRDVSEESNDFSADQATASQDEGQGQELRGVQGYDGQEGTEANGKTKRGLERRRRSKSEMKGVSLTSTAHTVTSSSSSSSSSDSATESLPLSPSAAHSGTSKRSRGGLKAKRDLPVKSEFRESKYLLSKYVT
jgi:hypothetical protein